MQRRSPRGRVSDVPPLHILRKTEPEPEETAPVTEPEQEPVVVAEPTPPKRRPGRPRRSEVKQVEKPSPVVPVESKETPENNDKVVLNARGMPVRQRKRNRYYDDEEEEEEEKSPVPKSKPEKKIKLEPLQILLDNPSNSLKVTPIISEAEGNEEGNGEASAPLVQAKKSAVELVLSTPEIKAESGTTKKTLSMQKTESKHNPPRATIPKGQSGRSKSENFKAIKSEFPKVDIYRRSDYSSFIRFFANVKTKVIMPDRWGINGVMFDPVRKMKTFTMAELEISPIGETRVKKCIQVFEDLSLLVTVQGLDLTGKMSGIKRLQSENDVPGIVSKICALKVCTGVKNFSLQDLNYHPTAKKKGSCYFASDCQTVLSFNYVGALCPPCNKLRNSVRRRKLKIKQEREKTLAKPNVKKVPSVFGRAVYGILDQLLYEDHKANKRGNLKLGRDGLPLRDIKHEPGALSANGRRRSAASLKTPRKPQKQRNYRDSGILGSPLTISHVIDPVTGVRHGIADYLTLGGDGNIVIQNGGEFNFDDGQEYELIGEADSVEPIHLVDGGGEQTIQIIEVDDQTMAHFAAQNINMSGMFFGDASNIQVTEIDPNDPNTVFKVLNPGEIYIQDQKI